MNSKIIEDTTTKETTYPAAYKNVMHNIVVLFWDDRSGVVLYSDDKQYKIGYTSTMWCACTNASWQPFHGKIELTF